MRPALVIVGPATVARKMELAERTGRAWAAGARRPEKPGEVARAIIAVAHGAGLSLPTDEHLRAEEICRELSHRAAAVQCFIAIAVEMLAERHGGVRGLARAIAKLRRGQSRIDLTTMAWFGSERAAVDCRAERHRRPHIEVQPFRNQEDASAHPQRFRPGW